VEVESKAFGLYQLALKLMRNVGNPSGEAQTLLEIAKIDGRRGNLSEARARVEDGLALVESQRDQLIGQKLRMSYRSLVQDYYDFYVDLLMRLHGLYPTAGYDALGLQASEQARARSLLETLAEKGTEFHLGINATHRDRERSLQQLVDVKTKDFSLAHRSGGPEFARKRKEFNDLMSEYQEVEAQILANRQPYQALTQS